MVESFLAPKRPILIPFCGMDHQKSSFSLISDTLSVGGCWGQPVLLFWKMVHQTQMGNPPDHAASDIISKFSIFLPPRAIYFRSYHYETPCMKQFWSGFIFAEKRPNVCTSIQKRNQIPRTSSYIPLPFKLSLISEVTLHILHKGLHPH